MTCVSVIFATCFKNEYFEQLVLSFFPHRGLEDIWPEQCVGLADNLGGFTVLLILGHRHGVGVRTDHAANEFFQRKCISRTVRNNLVSNVRGLRQLFGRLLQGKRHIEPHNVEIQDLVTSTRTNDLYYLMWWTFVQPGRLSGKLETKLRCQTLECTVVWVLQRQAKAPSSCTCSLNL